MKRSCVSVVLYKLPAVMEHRWVQSTRSLKPGEFFLRSLPIVAISVKTSGTVFPSGRGGCQVALGHQSSAFLRSVAAPSKALYVGLSGDRWPTVTSPCKLRRSGRSRGFAHKSCGYCLPFWIDMQKDTTCLRFSFSPES